MPHPRHRRLQRRQIGAEILQPVGLTNVAPGDVYNTTAIQNLQNLALYQADGTTLTFSASSATLLSDAVSNADGAWTAAGLTGETTDKTTVGLTDTAKHYYLPAPWSNTVTNFSSSNVPSYPVIVYSYDGPQAKYVPYYSGGTVTSGSILFGAAITGAYGAGTLTKLRFVIGGSGSNGDVISIRAANDKTLFSASGSGPYGPYFAPASNTSTASMANLQANGGKKSFTIPTASIGLAGGFYIDYTSSAKTSTDAQPGFWIVISAST